MAAVRIPVYRGLFLPYNCYSPNSVIYRIALSNVDDDRKITFESVEYYTENYTTIFKRIPFIEILDQHVRNKIVEFLVRYRSYDNWRNTIIDHDKARYFFARCVRLELRMYDVTCNLPSRLFNDGHRDKQVINNISRPGAEQRAI